MQTYGRPGRYASKLGRAALARCAALAAVALVAVAVAIALGAPDVLIGKYDARTVVGVITAALAVWAGLTARAAWRSSQRAFVGAASERRVARAIEQAHPVAVIHGALVGGRGGDIDHAVLGPALVAIETKTGSGPVRIEAGRVVVGRRTVPGNPVAQAEQAARRLGRMANRYAQAVLCIPDMSGRPRSVGAVTVCSLSSLPDVLARAPRVLDAPTAARLAAQLDVASRTESAERAARR